jgi:two-component system CheB/CheR fusion protein
MESLNEELSTVNNELSNKVQALSQARDDMKNLLNSTDLAVIFLDQQLRVKRYTEKARSLISLRETDIGRPIGDLNVQLLYDKLVDECREVLDTLVRKEEEVLTRQGIWHLMRILPYRTSENVIGGVVITFVEIMRIKEAEKSVMNMEFFHRIVETIREPLVVLDNSLKVSIVNDSFLRIFETASKQVTGKKFYELGDGHWNIPRLRELLNNVLSKNAAFENFPVEHDFPSIGHKKFMLNARRLKQAESMPELILLAMEEVD